MTAGEVVNGQTARRTATRANLVRAARELFAERGYAGAPADAIARAAGVSRATFYLHFRSKAELVIDLMAELEPRILQMWRDLDAMDAPTRDDVLTWLEEHAAAWQAHAAEFGALQQALVQETAVADEWFAMMERVAGQMTSLLRRRGDSPETRASVVSAMMGLDRSFYFVVLGRRDAQRSVVMRVLADQLVDLFGDAPR